MKLTFKTAAPIAILTAALFSGCKQDEAPQKDKDFSTSGSRDADQRAEQRIAKDRQINGKKATDTEKEGGERINEKKPLFERLGGKEGIAKVTADWVDRFLADPRVNYTRQGVTTGTLIKHAAKKWDKTPSNVDSLKLYYTDFFVTAAGGPARANGQDLKTMYEGRQVTNAEFDATIGDLKATLDAMRVPTEDQKELLAIVESTRPQVVEVR